VIAGQPCAAVSGASGYLGSRICITLESKGWQVTRLVRNPDSLDSLSRHFELGDDVSADTLSSIDLLIHAAYDLSLTSRADIWRINVDGTRRLLTAAHDAGVSKIIAVSSMSAFAGTKQLYGRAKLEIEAMTVASGGCAIRPGLVYGDHPGGMAGALRKLTRLPVVPIVTGAGRIYTVSEDDLMAVIAALAGMDTVPLGVVSVAHQRPSALSELMTTFAAQEGRRCRFFPVPWQLVYYSLRTAELLRLHLPFRADSLLGLVHTVPRMSQAELLTVLGVSLHAFGSEPGGES
jgi:nucleoside-diphosphate-sugar epimerase